MKVVRLSLYSIRAAVLIVVYTDRPKKKAKKIIADSSDVEHDVKPAAKAKRMYTYY